MIDLRRTTHQLRPNCFLNSLAVSLSFHFVSPQLPEYPNHTYFIIMNRGFWEDYFLTLQPNSGSLAVDSRG